jgi:HK97 gp10 family phage protein
MSIAEVRIEGHAQLITQLRALAGPDLRRLAKRVSSTAMAPVLAAAKSLTPVDSGRLAASIGKLATQNRAKTSFGSRVGTRPNYTYKTTSGERMVSGSKKFREKHQGRKLTTVSAQQYARLIEFGQSKDGKWKRRAGPVHFLETAIRSNQSRIITTIGAELRAYLTQRKANP